jgi:hypothetical protein
VELYTLCKKILKINQKQTFNKTKKQLKKDKANKNVSRETSQKQMQKIK